MTVENTLNALTSAIDCVQQDILAGNRGTVTINSDKVRPYDELDHDFVVYATLRQD
jgi:hypothetical protein